MKKRLQVILNEQARDAVEQITKSANENFKNGNITYSDVINEMILASNVSIEKLQLKHTNIRKSLRLLATQKDLDVDSEINTLLALKKGMPKKTKKTKTEMESQICLSQ